MGRPRYDGPVPRATVAVVLLALIACDRGDPTSERILKRAKHLRWLPLPNVERPGAAEGTFVNAEVPKILVVSSPPATVVVKGKAIGLTPCEVDTKDLLTDGTGDPFPIQLTQNGVELAIGGFALSYEAALFYEGVPRDLPEILKSRGLWLYLVAKHP